jgi:putative endonuclease
MNILKILTPRKITGNTGEGFAKRYLKKNKYRILEENFVANGHEVDIIAYKDKTVVFVEVKTRTAGHENPKETRPASSVNKEKQKAIISVAKYYTGFHRAGRSRFDVIEVYLNEKRELIDLIHMESAFISK